MGSGLAKSMSQIISARAVQGCGGAGMVCVVAILLTDLVPVHEVALYRSYVNVIQTIGRSCGGAVGGYLAQVIGWRWYVSTGLLLVPTNITCRVFLGQCPLVLVALWLVNKKLPDITKRPSNRHSTWDKLRRVDIAGAISMSLSIVFSLLILDTGGQRLPWDHPIIIGAAAIALASGTMFVLIENHWAQEPIFPLRLITQYPVVNSYTLIALQNLTQIAV